MTLGPLRVLLGVFGFNPRAVRVYEKAGFKEIGRRRQSYFADRRMWDEIWMNCLSSGFEGSGPGSRRDQVR